MSLFRAGLSYAKIAAILGRNHSSVGYVVRREDLREEAELIEAEETEDLASIGA